MENGKESRSVSTNVLNELDLSDLKLTQLEKNFLNLLLHYGFDHIVEAYKEASSASVDDAKARFLAHQILRRNHVQTVLERFAEEEVSAIHKRIELEMVQFWHSRAFWKATDIFNNDGTTKDLNTIPSQMVSAIDGIKVDYRGKDATRKIVHFDMANRGDAMKVLSDWMTKREDKKPSVPSDAVKDIKDVIANARKRAGADSVKMRAILERKTVTEKIKLGRNNGDSDSDEDEEE